MLIKEIDFLYGSGSKKLGQIRLIIYYQLKY